MRKKKNKIESPEETLCHDGYLNLGILSPELTTPSIRPWRSAKLLWSERLYLRSSYDPDVIIVIRSCRSCESGLVHSWEWIPPTQVKIAHINPGLTLAKVMNCAVVNIANK